MKKNLPKKLATTLLLLSISLCIKAQFGFSTGASISDVRHNNLLKSESPIITGFTGLSFQFRPVRNLKYFSIVTEFLYNVKGYKQVFEKDYPTYLHYFSLPILLNFNITNKLSLQGGTELSGLIVTSNKANNELYEQLDMGLDAGIGFLVYKNVQLFARYNYGLTPILNYDKSDEFGNTTPIKDIKNQNIMIGFKVIFIQ